MSPSRSPRTERRPTAEGRAPKYLINGDARKRGKYAPRGRNVYLRDVCGALVCTPPFLYYRRGPCSPPAAEAAHRDSAEDLGPGGDRGRGGPGAAVRRSARDARHAPAV